MVPAPEQVFKELADVLSTIKEALEYGTEKAKEFFDSLEFEEKLDPFLAPHLVRFHTKKTLENWGHFVTENEVNLEHIANSGLSLNVGRYNLRIFKSRDGWLPAPGHSLKRQHYYQQLPLEFHHIDDGSQKINLILLWEVTPEFKLGRLSLSCPKTGGLTRESVTAYWISMVPDDVLVRRTTEVAFIQPMYVEDIPLTPKMSKKTGSIDNND